MWIWQQGNWPNFEYDAEIVMPALSDAISHVAPLMLLANELDQDKKLALESKSLLDEALSSAKIEGEILDRDSVRSSIANRLGIGRVGQMSRNSAAFIDVLLESIRGSSSALTENDLFKWHSMLFLDKPILDDLIVGDYRNTQMRVISGRFGKE
jgi:Fic family protein